MLEKEIRVEKEIKVFYGNSVEKVIGIAVNVEGSEFGFYFWQTSESYGYADSVQEAVEAIENDYFKIVNE